MTATVHLRDALASDAELLFGWANDPETRRMSFSERPIARDEHRRWLAEKLCDPDCLLFIVTTAAGEPVGQVRFDVDRSREAVVSVSIAPDRRGRGLGATAIRLATVAVRRRAALGTIRAYVKPGNRASIRAFVKAGFCGPERTDRGGQPALFFYSGRSNQEITSNS